MNILLLLFLFIAFLILIEVVLRSIKAWRKTEKRQIERRLKELTTQKYDIESLDFVKKIKYSDMQFLDSFLSRFSVFRKMTRLLEQANIKQTLGYLILMTIAAVVIGLALTKINLLVGIGVVVVFGILPSAYVYFKKQKRMQKFEKQLPDTLDLVSRSLRAGLAFSGALKIVSEEFPDPVGFEFAKTVNEINFGISTDEALKNLTERIDCADLKFFVISVILQKETGGNLAEILENTAKLIRDRFKFQGKVRALSAEGKMSAGVLIAVPFFIAGLVSIFNPTYLKPLKDEPTGNIMVITALVMMVIGISILRKMIKLKV